MVFVALLLLGVEAGCSGIALQPAIHPLPVGWRDLSKNLG